MRKFISLWAACAAFVFSGGAFGQLTPGTPIATGTAQSLTPSVQNAGGNGVYSSGDFSDSTRWIQTAPITATRTNTAYSIERGTYPATLTGTASTSQIAQTSTVGTTLNQTIVASAYFTVKQAGTLIANASSTVELGINYTTGATKTYYVRFNPATGQVTGSSGTRVAVSIQSIPTYDPFIPGAINMWYRVGLGAQNYAPASSTVTMYIKPNATGSATGTTVISYGAQVESTPTNLTGVTYSATSIITAQPSAYLVTTQQSLTTRLGGALPRQSVLDTRLTYDISAATVAYDSAYNGYIFYAAGAAGASTINLPGASDNIQPGESFTVFNYTTSTNNITVAAALLGQIVAPDATTTSVTIAPGYSATFVARTNTIWYMTDMYSGGSSPPIPAPGAAGTIIRSNGTAWAVSQDTFPDLVASGNVMFATAANTWGSSANFTYDSTKGIALDTDISIKRYAAKQLMISGDGTGATTNAGIIAGYCGTSGYGCLWGSGVGTASDVNAALVINTAGTDVRFNAAAGGTIGFTIAGAAKVSQTSTAGAGPSITAGTAATNAPRALSISQTWTDGTTGNIGVVGNFDMGATGTATGKLLSLQAGAAGTTEVFYTAQTGQVGATQYSALSAVNGTVLLGSTATTSAFMGIRDAGVTTVRNVGGYGWVSNDNAGGGIIDTFISRPAAGIISFDTGTAGNGLASLGLKERTAPSAPAADGVYIYAKDNGGGKTQLCALFNTGAEQCFATEP